MEKSTKSPQEVKPKIGREFKFWHNWSDGDFQRWLKLTGFISTRYRILHLIASLMLFAIGILEIANNSIINGAAFTGFGALILFFLVLGGKEKR